MINDNNTYIALLRSLMETNADRANAALMKKYMRNKFEFFGIKSPKRKELFRGFLKINGYPVKEEMEMMCIDLYSLKERDFHYFAMKIAESKIKEFNESAVKLFEYMIVTNSWWDTVDFIAANILGQYFKRYPNQIREVTKAWMDSDNIWLQRSCILFQLKYKQNTDLELLFSFIDKLKSSNEFFIQKAIGWILREYSKINPDEVYRYTESTVLKPLSRREALRIMKKIIE